MNPLENLIGVERGLDEVNMALCHHVQALHAPVVGALHVTCADESELECIESFQRWFAGRLLPELKFARRAPFHLSNLGGRYEPGAVAVAEEHFTTAEASASFKVLLVKLNAHVAVEGSGQEMRFGQMRRYDRQSTACGTLHTLLAGGDRPFLRELRAAFQADDCDRLGALLDPARVAPTLRSLFVAITSAQLQARAALAEIVEHRPHSPTLYIVVACVTLNRSGEDTELLCGWHVADQRGSTPAVASHGLGDDPTRYRVSYALGRLQVTEAP